MIGIRDQVASMAHLECNRTVQTMMVWFAYEVRLSTNVPAGHKMGIHNIMCVKDC